MEKRGSGRIAGAALVASAPVELRVHWLTYIDGVQQDLQLLSIRRHEGAFGALGGGGLELPGGSGRVGPSRVGSGRIAGAVLVHCACFSGELRGAERRQYRTPALVQKRMHTYSIMISSTVQ